ncbi:MAG: Arc family DNA-binding protein [Deltaproteobacteria bacterium]|jgi:plasmid stability protein|nr:Arc family DNA-binding protein [Deltaproteobacteria bacterium]MBW2532225.1 Arc family DNA-binding protein [Deltaproteobacteria bacterium]
MPGLLIKDLPPHLHDALKARAELNRRSMGREALVILEDALSDGAGPPTLEEIDRWRVRGRKPLSQELLDRARGSGRP